MYRMRASGEESSGWATLYKQGDKDESNEQRGGGADDGGDKDIAELASPQHREICGALRGGRVLSGDSDGVLRGGGPDSLFRETGTDQWFFNRRAYSELTASDESRSGIYP